MSIKGVGKLITGALDGVSEPLRAVKELLSTWKGDPAVESKARALVMEAEAGLIAAKGAAGMAEAEWAGRIIEAEASSDDPYVRRMRPTAGYCCIGILVWWFLPWVWICRANEWEWEPLPALVVSGLFGILGGYMTLREVGKSRRDEQETSVILGRDVKADRKAMKVEERAERKAAKQESAQRRKERAQLATLVEKGAVSPEVLRAAILADADPDEKAEE